MKKITLTFATLILVSQFSLAIAADPGTRQLQRPPMQQQRGTVQPLKITPEYLNQQILALTQQVQALQIQVNSLRSVVQLTPNGATIQAENLSLHAGKTLSLKGGQDVTAEGASQIKLKAPLIKLNDGNKPIALQDSPVAGGKVMSGSTSVFAQ